MAHIDIGQDSQLKLYRDVQITAGQQVAFRQPAHQQAYFAERHIKTYGSLSYVYRSGIISIEDTPQVVANANYIAFTNPSFENKTIYGRITEYQYLNNATVSIAYEVDWFQTFMFDVTYRGCQIEREHLLENDWQRALANPWRRDILELNTQEAFNFGETDYNYVSTASNRYHFMGDVNTANFRICMLISSAQFEAENYPQLASWKNIFTFLDDDELWGATAETFNRPIGMSIGTYGNVQRGYAVYVMSPSDLITYDPGTDDPMGGTHNLFKFGLDSLTLAGLTSCIIGIYFIPSSILPTSCAIPSMHIATGDTTWSKTFQPSALATEGRNPKLKRSPYSYIRVVGPSSAAKEFRYELFENPTNGIFFATRLNLNGVPLLSLFPTDYRYGIGGGSGGYPNVEERLDYSELVQVGYSTDAFLTYLSGQYQRAISNLGNAFNSTRSAMGLFSGAVAAGSMAGSAGSAGSAGVNNSALLLPASTNAGQSMVSSMMSGMEQFNTIYYVRGYSPLYDYGAEKRAYIADEYHAGSSGGYWPYAFSRLGFEFAFMTLTPAMAELVDEYFDTFGYNSGRIGIPRICNFIKQGWMPDTQMGQISPHFVENAELGRTTYVKTVGMRVISNLKPASDYIEAIFDSGHLFIDGSYGR